MKSEIYNQKMGDWQLSTAVGFIIFNRPETTYKVFEMISKAKPPKLLIVADGPRNNKVGEDEKCRLARAVVDLVDWDCEIITNFSDVNLGCKKRVSSGIKWIFEMVEEAIILEDDCLPSMSFFRFCEELLNRYRLDTRVMMICGTNLASNDIGPESYYYSRYPHIWGWASWRRVINKYDPEFNHLDELMENQEFRRSFDNLSEYRYWRKIFYNVKSGIVNTWDAQIMFQAFASGAKSIFPNVNLISNIGFGEAATHTTQTLSVLSNNKANQVTFPLNHPSFFIDNVTAEKKRKYIERVGWSLPRKLIFGIAEKLNLSIKKILK